MRALRISLAAVTIAVVANHANMSYASSDTLQPTMSETWMTDAWTSDALRQLEAREHRASSSTRGLQRPTGRKDLRTFFRDAHIEVVPRRGDEVPPWRFRWQTDRWGRPGHWTAVVGLAPLIADGARVSYHSPGLLEWYENRPQGIEQGFTIERRPAGDGPLRIERAIGFYDPGDVHVLHYDALRPIHVRRIDHHALGCSRPLTGSLEDWVGRSRCVTRAKCPSRALSRKGVS